MSFQEDGTLVASLVQSMCGDSLLANSGIWVALTAGWILFMLSSAALVQNKRKAMRIRRIEAHTVSRTAADALFLFKQPNYDNPIPLLESNTSVFDLMWTEQNQDKTVWKQVYGAKSMFMGTGRVMIIVNDGSEPTVFIKTPLYIADMEQFVTSHKHLFTNAPKKLTLVLLGPEELAKQAQQLEEEDEEEE